MAELVPIDGDQGFWLNGKQRTGPAVIVRNPFGGAVVGRVCRAGVDDIEAAMAAMTASGQRLAEQSAADRKGAIGAVMAGLQAGHEEFARLITLETAKPIRAARGEVDRAIMTFRLAMEACNAPEAQAIPVQSQPGFADYTCRVMRVPIGPCLFITPFNFPLNLVAHKIAPAMAVGCPFIIKPSDRTPLTALRLGRLLAAANLPVGSWHVLPVPIEQIHMMVRHAAIRLISFTGSETVGWELRRHAAGKVVLLELGSNSPVVVEPDADLPDAVRRIARGAFGFSGQSCISVQRIYVQRSIAPDFVEQLVAETRGLHCGDPMIESTDAGPMIDLAAAERVEQWVNEAVEQGGRYLCGGRRRGNFYEPTLLADVPDHLRIVRRELFGPAAVIKEYADIGEAIRLCNDPRLGIHAGIFTRNSAASDLAVRELDFAGVVINDVPANRAEAMPYGGNKFSGLGREGVRYAMEHFTQPKAVLHRKET